MFSKPFSQNTRLFGVILRLLKETIYSTLFFYILFFLHFTMKQELMWENCVIYVAVPVRGWSSVCQTYLAVGFAASLFSPTNRELCFRWTTTKVRIWSRKQCNEPEAYSSDVKNSVHAYTLMHEFCIDSFVDRLTD